MVRAMTPLTARFTLVLCLLLLYSSSSAAASLSYELPSDKKYAYVTLLYNDDFAFAVRTLGQSLRDTQNHQRNNRIDHLVLVTSGVSASMQEQLETDGWKVKRVEQAANPNANFDKRLKGVYTKLEIFRLTEYHRVVYLDADTTLLENTDELFLCGRFCAVMRHSELINTGIIVVEPSLEMHKDLERQVASLYSYTGGDQGFLNSYFPDYADCPYFEPMKNIGLTGDAKCRRLPHRYNGDWPIAMLNGKLEMVRTKNSMQAEFGEFRRARILHYTVGSFKPWDWFAPAIFPFTHYYTNVAARLPSTAGDRRQFVYELLWIALGGIVWVLWIALLGMDGSSFSSSNGISHRQTTKAGDKWRSLLPNVLQLIRQALIPRNGSSGSAWTMPRDPLSRGALVLHLLGGYGSLLLGIGMGLKMVPGQTHNPLTGFAISLTWAFGVFFSTYSLYLYRWYLHGIAHDWSKTPVDAMENGTTQLLTTSRSNTPPPSAKPSSSTNSGNPSQALARTESLSYASVMVALVVLFVLARINTPTETLGQVLPSLVGLAASTILGSTVVFYRLPILWYQEGLSV